MTKPLFSVDISPSAQSPLEAHLPLALLTKELCRHQESGLRAPLGIYNISVSRICDKVIRLCQRMENYFIASETLEPLQHSDDLMQEVVDYIELALYAAAEHIDDVDSIASGFFRDSKVRDKIRAYRTLQTQLKQHKKLVAAAANAIKHQQSRIRIFSMEFRHEVIAGCLHGYFIEGVDAGVRLSKPHLPQNTGCILNNHFDMGDTGFPTELFQRPCCVYPIGGQAIRWPR